MVATRSKKVKNILILLVGLVFIASILLLSIILFPNQNETIVGSAAVGYKTDKAADLDSGIVQGYLKPGLNSLSSAAHFADNLSNNYPLSGTTEEEYFAKDFYCDENSSARFSAESLQFKNGSVGTLLKVNNGTYPANALAQALSSNEFIIKIRFECEILISGTGPSNANLETVIYWYPAGIGTSEYATKTSLIPMSSGSQFSHFVDLGGDDADSGGSYYDANNVLCTNTNIIHDAACFLITMKDPNNASDGFDILIRSPRVYIDVEAVGLSINIDMYAIEISGENREATAISRIKDVSSDGPQILSNTFVKAGDQLDLTARVDKQGLPYVFPTYYPALFYPVDNNFDDRTCIDWHTYNTNYDETIGSYLEAIPLPESASPSEQTARKSGYSVSFQVKDGVGNTPQVKLLPRLPISIERGNVTYYEYSVGNIPNIEIVVKVDNVSPSIPIIDEDSTFGKTIKNKRWYTTSRTMHLEYSSELTTDFINNSREKVYAYVLSSEVSTFDVSSCDFSLPNDHMDSRYPFYGVGSGIDEFADRQDLGNFSNIMNFAEKFALNFSTPGEYTLVLVAVDRAGNVSSPMIYHRGNNQTVRVDDTTQEVGFNLMYGTTAFISDYVSVIGNVTIFLGEKWHEKDDETQKWTCTAAESVTSGDGVVQKRVEPSKRDIPVTLRLTMPVAAYNNYRLVMYSNQPAMEGMVSDSPTFKLGRDNARIYEITFFTNDEIWNSGQSSGMVTMFFNKRVDLGLITTDFTYSKDQMGNGNIVALDSFFEAYFPYDPNTGVKTFPERQPDIDITYYEHHEYQVYIATTVNNGQIVTTTGGYINYKGTEYHVPNDYDLLANTRVSNIAFIPGLNGDSGTRLYTLKRRELTPVTGYKVYTAEGFMPEFGKNIGFIDAGKYVYKATVDVSGDTNLFGESVNIFEIKKATPNVFDLHTKNTLFYGDSLNQLMFGSSYENGSPITDPGFEYASENYFLSSAGVYGYFEITSPQHGTETYNKPQVSSSMPITVRFHPIEVIAGVTNEIMNDNWDTVFSRYYDRVMVNPVGPVFEYTLKPGKSHSKNYETQLIEMNIEIKHAKAYIDVDYSTIRKVYNEEPQGLTAKAYLDVDKTIEEFNVPFIITYVDKTTGIPLQGKPESAGNYQAKIDIDKTSSNYENDVSVYQDFIIDKKELNVYPIAPEGELGLGDYVYEELPTTELLGQYQFDHKFTFIYGYLEAPSYKFGVYENEIFEEITGLYVNHSFSKYRDENGQFLDPFGDWVTQTIPGVLLSDMLSAGWHIAEITIENQNYSGGLYAIFVIEQGTPLGNLLTVNLPQFKRTYSVVDYDGTPKGVIGHLEYGQTLAAGLPIMLQGLSTSASYKYRNNVTKEIQGRFYFESETEYYLRQASQSQAYFDVNGQRILDVNYGTGNMTNRVIPHAVTLYWEAGEYIGAEFIPNNNFGIVSFSTDIVVARARANVDNIYMSSITYGQKLLNSDFVGDIVSNGKILERNVHYSLNLITNNQTVYNGGTHNVRYSLNPLGEYLRQYLPLNDLYAQINVISREITISFPADVKRSIEIEEYDSGSPLNLPIGVVYEYGSLYSRPTTIVKTTDTEEIVTNIQLEYLYFKDKPNDGYVLQSGESYMDGYENYVRLPRISSTTESGRYYMLVRPLGNNYIGSVFEDFYVIKADLYYTQPNLPSIEYGQCLGDYVFSQILVQNRTNTISISGSFSFVDEELMPEVGSTDSFLVKFIPRAGSTLLYNNFKPIVFPLAINVLKKTLVISVADNTQYVFTGGPKAIMATVLDPENLGVSLPLVYEYFTVDGLPPTQVGIYNVKVSIDNSVEKFRGFKSVTVEITKSPVTIDTTDVEKEYTGLPQELIPNYSFVPGTNVRDFIVNDIEGFRIRYYDHNGLEMNVLPKKVGKYRANVQLVAANYKAQETNINFYIKPSIKEIRNLEQTYVPVVLDPNAPRVLPVELIFNKVYIMHLDEYGNEYVAEENHQSVQYTVFYRYLSSAGIQPEFSSNLDINNAGVYDLEIRFSENGYNKIITGEQLIVAKRSVSEYFQTSLQSRYVTTYTGFTQPLTNISLPADIQNATIYYKQYEDSDEDSGDFINTVAPTQSGLYKVRIVLESENYEGIGETEYEIKKAKLTIVSTPTTEKIEFSTEKENVLFKEGTGEVRFATTGEVLSNRGTWSIETDITSPLCTAGSSYSVVVRFTPDETINTNFLAVEKEMSISITKRDISEFIQIEEQSLNKIYSGSRQGARAIIAEAANIIPGYGRIKLTYQYNGVVEDPKDVGVYSLVVKIVEDNNYVGTTTARSFKITMAEPLIESPPRIRDVNKGDTLVNGDIIPNTGHVVNPIDNTIKVQGSFQFDSSNVMNEANIHKVLIHFIPNESLSYKSILFEVDVKVIGLDLNVTSVEVVTIQDVNGYDISYPYGTKLYDTELSITPMIDGVPLSEDVGVWEWVDNNEIIDVGGVARYRIIPTDLSTYNIYEGSVIVPYIHKADMQINMEASNITIYAGEEIDFFAPEESLNINFIVNNAHNSNLVVNPKIEISDQYSVIEDINSFSLSEDYYYDTFTGGKYLRNSNGIATIKFKLTNSNYNELIVEFSVRVYKLVGSSSFEATRIRKCYDGEMTKISDFNIRVSDTEIIIDENKLFISDIHNFAGEKVTDFTSTALTPGMYSVTVEINDIWYAGQHTFSYEVINNDITEFMSINHTTRVYADNQPAAKASFGQFYDNALLTTGSVIIYKYWSQDKTVDLGYLPPRNAGNYWLEVSIDAEDMYFSARKIVPYTILKKELSLALNESYVFRYGQSYAVEPEIGNGLSVNNCNVSYYLIGESLPLLTKPTNVGRYRIRFSINHQNYFGAKEVMLTINQIALELNVSPQIDALEYGTKLNSAGFSGGEVISADMEAIRVVGQFVFVDPDLTPPVGVQTVQIRFEPTNKNYAPLTFSSEITVKKRRASIHFVLTSMEYNGLPQLPLIATDPALNINVRYSIEQDGLTVTNATEVGMYKIIATIHDENYEGRSVLDGFQIVKANIKLSESVMPNASAIEYNQALNKSSLLGGKIVYVSGKEPVAGIFRYKNPDLMLGPVGNYTNIGFVFIPVDTKNYEVFEGSVTVSVTKANASIQAFDTEFVYGDQIKRPRFVTSPANLTVLNQDFEDSMYNMKDVGIYVFNATISDHNYTGHITYNLVITKKVLEIQFYQGTAPIDKYIVSYGQRIEPIARIKPSSLAAVDAPYRAEIERHIMYYYKGVNGDMQLTVNRPYNIGEYLVVARMESHNNYRLDDSIATLRYEITRARVERLDFDHTLLSTQVYGNVTMPSVLVTPASVRYKIYFPGSSGLPTTAGTHSVRVEVIDENYIFESRDAVFKILPLELNVENIKVQDKPVDGLSEVKVTGVLSGVREKDEVFLTLTAHTDKWATTVGQHDVIISSWKLTGLHASNYAVREPIYSLKVNITNKVIKDESSESYVTSSTGFDGNITVSFGEVYDSVNRTNFITSLIGQKAIVQSISIKENGLDTVLSEKVKYYVKIPDAYLGAQNLEVKGLGALSNQSIQFTQEGDFITFYADTSGEILFYVDDFPYWIIIVVSVVLILTIGAILVFILLPKKKRKVTITSDMRKAHEWVRRAEEFENKAEMDKQIRDREKRRRWKM